jgi:hypothetical protein
VVYAGLTGFGYMIIRNRSEMVKRQDALKVRLDNDPNTIDNSEFKNLPDEVLRSDRNYYRTNRDYGIIGFALFYVIQIVDAAVDAHLYHFDIDRPLAGNSHRRWHLNSPVGEGGSMAIGLSYTF